MKIGIIGGGAAGMMAAATINENNPRAEIFLIEKNAQLGKKVLISGGGRCNVTTGLEDIKEVLKKYPRGEKFLTGSMYAFSPSAVVSWFEEHGVPMKCEDDLRVFPASNRGQDVVGAFKKVFAKHKTTLLTQHNVKKIGKAGKGFLISFKEQSPLSVDKVVLSLGGQAYRATGSTGDGYALAEGLGHTITKLAPSLFSFIIKETWHKQLAGVSIKKAVITSGRDKKQSAIGAFLFTHAGVTGPAVFALSSYIAFEDFGPKNPLAITIDFASDEPAPEVRAMIRKFIIENPKKNFKSAIHRFVPMSLAEIICKEINIDKKNAEASAAEIEKAVKYIKALPLCVIGRGAGDEFVTAGGVDTAEVDPKTMESKKCFGLYLAGEILCVDGFTGGFNLQAAWATGRAAGLAASE